MVRETAVNVEHKQASVYTDEARAYIGLDKEFDHGTVNHSVGKYVDGKVHTNGIESFWAMLKRGHYGTYHKMSPKHLDRYVDEFQGRHNARTLDTVDQMGNIVTKMERKRLTYQELVEPNGLSNFGRNHSAEHQEA